MKITIDIELDNAAFSNDDSFNGMELGRILAKVADQLDGNSMNRLNDLGDCGNVRDINGNNVGSWVVE